MALLMIMAGGTGGHIYPALAVAETLRRQGVEIVWVGTPGGMESRIVPGYGFDMAEVDVRGLRGKGWRRWLTMPLELLRAVAQMRGLIRQWQPQALLGMGGFVSGPGGLAAKLAAVPLLIHEANAIPGLTNRCLAYIATVVMSGFEGVFSNGRDCRFVGNPVSAAFGEIPAPGQRLQRFDKPLRLLITGGSQGAGIFNDVIPKVLGGISTNCSFEVRHQCGRGRQEALERAYQKMQVATTTVLEFIDDMPAAYAWSDLVISRAGAMTVAELAAAGAAAILCPYPLAVGDHQTANARYLVDRKAAVLVSQADFTVERLARLLRNFSVDRASLLTLATAASQCA
ncbi:MAG TPA: undecaprenyldiphospho-muramoylpentapeptide beta-N-acetylglucosaminyltransferase, partial [Gammaproteobacteria bacterium]|nr:undecaprenyldiphospho-muramoylpentapeptide beta-N-acetylglucosaminyltransferase [Gammaproteobacteria bacterium]